MSVSPDTSSTSSKKRTRHVICRADELPVGTRKIVQIGRRSIGVFNVDGKLYALRNTCPHQLAPLCTGNVGGTTAPSDVGEYIFERDGQILRCPWHKWEFDIATGQSVFNPHKLKVATYTVCVEDPETGEISRKTCTAQDPDPAVETYPVAREDLDIVLYL